MKIFHNDDLGKLILRLMVGGLMLFHGIAKLQHGIGFIEETLVTAGLPAQIAYGVYIGEVLAPILIILGIQVRLSALTVVFTMVGAIYLVHMEDILSLTKQGAWGIEVQMFFLMGALSLLFMGAGKYIVSNKTKG
ncbi:MAG: DoxX family protein [uncultured Sulfurovum sp.]|uniref:DoxX family protein n=1 Tax=uncultured Sulfurovum sp. TaxID=269237 RepID=A0A6S6SS54_9BACT|nr:MAG: DoxX family protein [uncultured Sulfurovum sp.]